MAAPTLTMQIDGFTGTGNGPPGTCGESQYVSGLNGLLADEQIEMVYYGDGLLCSEGTFPTCISQTGSGWAGAWDDNCADWTDNCISGSPIDYPPNNIFASLYIDLPPCTVTDCQVGLNGVMAEIFVISITPQGGSLTDCLLIDVEYLYRLQCEMRPCKDPLCGTFPGDFTSSHTLSRTVTGIGPFATKAMYVGAIWEAAKGTFTLGISGSESPVVQVTVA